MPAVETFSQIFIIGVETIKGLGEIGWCLGSHKRTV